MADSDALLGRSADLDAPAWGWRSGTYRALELTFAVRTTDAGLGRYLGGILATLEAGEQPSTVFTVVERDTDGRGSATDHRYEISVDGELVLSTSDASRVVPH